MNFKKLYFGVFQDKEMVLGKKINGHIFACAIKKYIETILLDYEGYYVSNYNSYIKGSNIEWDLLIVKENPLNNYLNIYDAKNVVAALELKGASEYDVRNINDINSIYSSNGNKNRYNKFLEEKNIRFIYISLCLTFNKFNLYSEVFNNFKNNNGKQSVFVWKDKSWNNTNLKKNINYIINNNKDSDFVEFIKSIITK